MCDNPDIADGIDRFVSRNEWKLRFLFGFLFFALSGSFLPMIPATGIDASWVAAINYAVENQIRFGKDFIFTYGPLGFLGGGEPGRLWIVVLFYLVLSITAGWVIPLKDKWNLCRFVMFAAAEFLCSGFCFFSILLPVCFWFSAEKLTGAYGKKELAAACLLCLVGACFVLIKFMYIVPFLVASLCSDLLLLYRKKKIFFTPVWTAGILIGWVAVGQKIQDFPVWMYGAYQISSFYSEAMSTCSIIYCLIGVIAFEAFCLLLLFDFLKMKKDRIPKILFFLLILILVFTSMKHGFVRCDQGHFYSLLVSQLILISVFVRVIPGCSFVLFFCDCIILLLFCGPQWLSPVRDPICHLKKCRSQTEFIKDQADKIPILKKIKGSTIDSYPWDLSEIIYSGHRYSPRPIPQSYSAYSPWLMRKNAEKLAGDTAPSYVLWKIQSIDRRLPSLDDCASWPVILEKYSPAGSFLLANDDSNKVHHLTLQKETSGTDPDKWLVLKKKSGISGKNLTFHSEQIAGFEEIVRLPVQPGKLLWMSLKIEYTLLGEFLFCCCRPPFVYLTVKAGMEDARIFRILPATAGTPFLIFPLIETTSEFEQLLSGKLPTGPENVKMYISTNWFFHDPEYPSSSRALNKIWKLPIRIRFYVSDYPCGQHSDSRP